GQQKADKVDGAIGELSQFHQTYSYYAQGVDLTTAKLPNGWRDRLLAFDRDDAAPARARCLDKHDLVIAKLVTMREKTWRLPSRCSMPDSWTSTLSASGPVTSTLCRPLF